MAVLPPRRRTSDMSFWSRYDPVRNHNGPTDNWAKLHVKASKCYAGEGVSGVNVTQSTDSLKLRNSWQTSTAHIGQPSSDGVRRFHINGFSTAVNDQLKGHLPGSSLGARSSANLRRSWMNNEFHRRALAGFRYWLIERPKPTSFGRYGFGSYKTALGVGNAPRT